MTDKDPNKDKHQGHLVLLDKDLELKAVIKDGKVL